VDEAEASRADDAPEASSDDGMLLIDFR